MWNMYKLDKYVVLTSTKFKGDFIIAGYNIYDDENITTHEEVYYAHRNIPVRVISHTFLRRRIVGIYDTFEEAVVVARREITSVEL